MRGSARLTGHESCMRVDENYKRIIMMRIIKLNKMADVSERFSDTQEKPEASDVQVITHNIRRRKKENIITYHRQVTVGVMTRTFSSLTSVKKRRKNGTVEATSKNKEIEKRNGVMTKYFELLISTRRDNNHSI